MICSDRKPGTQAVILCPQALVRAETGELYHKGRHAASMAAGPDGVMRADAGQWTGNRPPGGPVTRWGEDTKPPKEDR